MKATTKFLLSGALAIGLVATVCAPTTSTASNGGSSDAARTVNIGIV